MDFFSLIHSTDASDYFQVQTSMSMAFSSLLSSSSFTYNRNFSSSAFIKLAANLMSNLTTCFDIVIPLIGGILFDKSRLTQGFSSQSLICLERGKLDIRDDVAIRFFYLKQNLQLL